MIPPEVPTETLPAPVRAAWRRRAWDDVVACIEGVSGWETREDLVVAWGAARLAAATDIHVDDVEEAAQAVLARLKDAGATAAPILSWAERLLQIARSPPGPDLLDQTRAEAIQLGQSSSPDDQLRASVLYRRLAAVGDEDAAWYAVASALHGVRGGDTQALPVLEATARRRDWKGGQQWILVRAWIGLIDAAADRETFAARWAEATSHPLIVKRERFFPDDEGAQERWLAVALDHELVEIAAHITRIVKKYRKRAPDTLTALVRRADALCRPRPRE